MTSTEVMQRWIESAAAGRMKFDKRELTAEENALLIQVLQCIAGDLLMVDQKVRREACEAAAQVARDWAKQLLEGELQSRAAQLAYGICEGIAKRIEERSLAAPAASKPEAAKP